MTIREFDPLHLTPRDSINRVPIATIPYDAPDGKEVEGRIAYELLSSEALAMRIRGGADKWKKASREIYAALSRC